MTASGQTGPIIVRGRLLDGAGAGIPDGVLEFWAAGFDGVGRVWSDADGGYRLETRMPMSREEPGGSVDAPHFAVRVLARGILTEYVTRVYFDGDPANEQDAILREVPADRRATLLAVATALSNTALRNTALSNTALSNTAPNEYHFDIVVQGERETVFFDL